MGGHCKRLDSEELGITALMIAKPTRKVLNVLKRKGSTWLNAGFYVNSRCYFFVQLCCYVFENLICVS